MATKSIKNPPMPGWHPSLGKVFKDAELWWQTNMVKRNLLDELLNALKVELEKPGQPRGAISALYRISHVYSMQCCTKAAIDDKQVLSQAMSRAVFFRTLDFRTEASLSLPHSHQPVLAFWSSMKAASAVMLGDWDLAEVCARLLVDVGEKDLQVNPSQKDGWRRGTNDAFLISLLAEAFGLDTGFGRYVPLIPEYQELLDAWRTENTDAFRSAMQLAADFHVSRSREGTNKMTYEFEKSFDCVYPGELLAVQSLRRRRGLPYIETGHALIDQPWALISELEPSVPHPLAIEVEERLRRDYPSFR